MTLRRRILESLRYQGQHGGLEISTVLTDAYGYSADSKNGVLTPCSQSYQRDIVKTDNYPTYIRKIGSYTIIF